MKEKNNVTVYTCDFCKKKLFVKSAMERHENWCTQNPKNKKKCEGCSHLQEVTVDYEVSISHDIYNGSETRKAKAFRCAKLNKLVYPLIVEKKGLVKKYPETFEEQEPMPTICEHYTDPYLDMQNGGKDLW